MDPSVISIVSGLPRSGTSLMMQMLAAGGIPPMTDNQRTADEDNPRGYLEFEAVKKTKQDAAWLNDAPGKVVKMVHLLLYDLPPDRKYKVVFMRRDLTEVVASQRKMLQRHNKPGAAVPDAQLIKIFDEQLKKLFAWLPTQKQFEVIEVGYNALMKDPAPVVKQLNAFFGGQMDEAKMLGTVDPSLYRNRAG